MIDYKQLAADCNTLAWALEGAAADNRVTAFADKMAAHERECWYAILDLLGRASETDKFEHLYGEEIGRRKAAEVRAERAEKEAEACRTRMAEVMDIVKDIPADRLQELIQADREGRCFVFMVPPDRNSNKSEVVICDEGEAWLQIVYEVDVGRNSAGEMNCIYLTEGGADFETADIGKTVFLPHEEDKIEAALAKMQEDSGE